MGKRPNVPTNELQNFVTPPSRRTIRKRKISTGNVAATSVGHGVAGSGRSAKAVRLNSDADDADEDSSSNDTQALNCSTKHANNSSILLNSTFKLEQSSPANNDSPRPVYTLRPSIVNGTILYDLTEKPWRLGNPIGKGNFGEIFLASDNITLPVTSDNAKYVVKIEPHSNGPLFVEIHCLMNTAKKEAEQQDQQHEIKVENKVKQHQQKAKESPDLIAATKPSGIPDYIASGSHYFGDARYRFLVLQRFDKDLHSLIRNSCVMQKSVLTLAIQIVNVLENLHDKGYCHNDVKSQNLMISKCKYYEQVNNNHNKIGKLQNNKTTKGLKKAAKFLDNYEEKQPTTDSGNSSEQEANDYDYDDHGRFVVKRKSNKNYECDDDYYVDATELAHYDEDDEDFDDGTTTTNSNSMDIYETPTLKGDRKKGTVRGRVNNRAAVQYSGSNPVRSCRRQQRPNSIYEEMVTSHYLRPSNKRISYSEFFDEDGNSLKGGFDGQFAGSNMVNQAVDSRAYVQQHETSIQYISSEDDCNEFEPHSLRRRIRHQNSGLNNSSTTAKHQKSTKSTSRQNGGSNKKQKTENSTPKRLTRRQEKLLSENKHQQQLHQPQAVIVEAEHIFLIDFGLASKYIDYGVHRPFIMDQRRAHDGTLEFTSRDAHMGAHSRRSDLECLGYNLLYWSQGFLPWKDAAANQQQEKVHRAKEYLMTDVREMLKLIYGKDVPKYLGEFLHLVGQLAYHERPQYARYRRLFEHEYLQLGCTLTEMRLDSQQIARDCVRIRKDHGGIEKHDFFEKNNKLICNNHILSIIKGGGGVGINFHNDGSPCTPFLQERNSIGDRVSPKNLRSKSDKKLTRKKKFNWAEVLSQDPDQIARERAEKEFDRELNYEEERPVRRYEGNPTYAILELIKKNEDKYKLTVDNDDDEEDEDENDQVGDVEEDEEENESNEASEVEAEVSSNNDSDDDESMQTENGEDDENVDEEIDHNEEISLGVESESDDDNDDNDDEVENNDEEVESDISEASSNSEQCGTRGRNKQRVNRNSAANLSKGGIRNVKPTRRAVSAATSRSSKSTTTSTQSNGTGKGKKRKDGGGCVTQIKTRSNGPAIIDDMDIGIQRQGKTKCVKNVQSKRGGSGRGGRGPFAASATGEVEQQALKLFLYDHRNEQLQQQEQNNGNMLKERGKRLRCTQKTDKGSGGGAIDGHIYVHDDDSDSNLMMMNVWKKSNENIYARNAAAAVKTLKAGGNSYMITRHYRK